MNEITRFIDLLVKSAREEHRISGEDASASLKLARATLIQAIERKLTGGAGRAMSDHETWWEWMHDNMPDSVPNAKDMSQFSWDASRKATWLPIESAPKDGTEIILCEGAAAPYCGEWKHEEWADRDGSDYRIPTHWQPLPAPPV